MSTNAFRALGAALALALVPGVAAAAPGAQTAAADQLSVDINRAGVEELKTLPGIGPALAQRIVEHRAEHGPFRKAEELLAVKGIGPKLLEKLRPHLVVTAAKSSG